MVSGFSQRLGLDFDQTFTLVVKPATIQVVLHLASLHKWSVHQLDVKNTFLHGSLSEEVYFQQPPGFVDKVHSDHICILSKYLYGLK